MNNNTLRIGTRKSRLAMVQTEIVREEILAHFPFLEVEIVPMSTKGDQILDRSLTSFGGKGVFTKELEEALLRGEIDLAVHSAKDMPMEFPKGLALGAVPRGRFRCAGDHGWNSGQKHGTGKHHWYQLPAPPDPDPADESPGEGKASPGQCTDPD